MQHYYFFCCTPCCKAASFLRTVSVKAWDGPNRGPNGKLARIRYTRQTDAPALGEKPASIVAPEYLMAIERRFEALERRRFDSVTVLGLGICMGLLFAAILIGLAWLYGG